jgi:hypothetical protein
MSKITERVDIKHYMKKIKLLSCLFFLALSVSVYAQSGSVKNVSKSVFTLTTFSKDKSIKASSCGVFIDDHGTAIAPFEPFIGADSATVVDASGAAMPVDFIMGADENYDVVKFKVDHATKGAGISSQSAPAGSDIWIVAFSNQKPNVKGLKVGRVEKFKNVYNYYVSDFAAPETDYGCPVVDGSGKILGILKSLDANHTSIIDAQYINSLKVNALTSQTMTQTGIRTGLPDTEKDATTAMFLARSLRPKSDNYKYAHEFINMFPNSSQGYKSLAELYVADSLIAEADKEMKEGIEKSTLKDEAHSNYSSLIFSQALYHPNQYKDWTLDKALEEAEKAYQIKPEPVYKHQQAQIIYAKGNYQQAYDMFMGLTKTPLNNGELWYECAQCKIQLKAPNQDIKVLLDSAVNVSSRKGLAAPYYLARGRFFDANKQYRDAIKDYYVYDSLSHTQDPAFFFMRYQCELNAKMWQQALLDIARASLLNPQEPVYLANWASLDLRVNRIDEAISTATQCTKLAPSYPEGYLLLGLAQIAKKQKAEGLKNLEKAKSLGDSRAQGYIDKNK